MALGCIKLGLAGAYLYFQAAPGPVPAPWIPGMAVAASEKGPGKAGKKYSVSTQGECRPELLAVIRARVRNLDMREAELDRRQKDLDLLKSDVETMLEELKKLQSTLGGPVKKAQKESDVRFQHLVGVYSSMDPGRAATLLGKMDKKTVTRIFASMKSKKVAAIMALMDPEAAASISAGLTRMGK